MSNLIIFDFQGTLLKSMRPPRLNGSRNTLRQLTSANTLAIFTGASQGETINILKKLKIFLLFDPVNIITKGQFPSKPNASAIKWLITKNQPASTVYIGDTRKDFKCSQSANVPFIFVGRQKLGQFQITTLDELLNVKIKL